MIELWKSFVHAFLYDEMAIKRWVRGLLSAGAMVMAQVILDQTWYTWTFKQWTLHMVPSIISFAAGSVTAPGASKP